VTRSRRAAAVAALALIVGGAGLAAWLDKSRTPADPVGGDLPAAPRDVQSPREVPSETPIAAEGQPPAFDADTGENHIGEYLDPDADWQPSEEQPRHIGTYLDPDLASSNIQDDEVSHIGEYLDPEAEDTLPVDVGEPRHIGPFIDPDARPADGETTSHIGERLAPPPE